MRISVSTPFKHAIRRLVVSALMLDVSAAMASDKEGLLRKGKAALEAMNYRKAIKAFERARAAEGRESFETSFGLARAYLAIGEFPEAVEAAQSALGSTQVPLLRAYAYNVLGTVYYHDLAVSFHTKRW